MIPGNTGLYRMSTVWKNVKYAVFKATPSPDPTFDSYFEDCNGRIRKVSEYIQEMINHLTSMERGIIFCSTKSSTENVAGRLGCDWYHRELDANERAHHMSKWRDGESKVIVGTAAMSHGVDFPGILFVSHLGCASSIINFAQESGQAGHDLSLAYSTTFTGNDWYDEKKLGAKEMDQYLSTQCRRASLSVLDGRPAETCADLIDVVLCDICSSWDLSSEVVYSSWYQKFSLVSLTL